ncbi:SGNH/GDSL hydrolase family protein [Saprospira sp. CCB-QB6]|uniref:SGNH/GDSL hydrolase family protein n=1 Tax=Saprospira sp. CCB-QB6 TaxID=3023936 RepID=UPI00234914B0|nr:SGNH/GDSL hydrolase family protein [Saprospira sp. CCB-QB6]WCL80975.1 SGNH/GDSL hydrolase family protein [Saprospira sp. CCB-QB6]
MRYYWQILGILILLWLGLFTLAKIELPPSWSITFDAPGLRAWLQDEQAEEQVNIPAPLSKSDSLEQEKEPKEDKTAAKSQQDSSSKYILLAGDSMIEHFKASIKKEAKAHGHQIISCIWYGSHTTQWSKKKKLQELIKDYQPDIIFFSVGGNETLFKNIEDRRPYIKDIKEQAKGIPFIWIGPPNWKADNGFNQILKEEIGPSYYYPSIELRDQLARKSDGAHPTRKASAIWAKAYLKWFAEQSAYKNHCWIWPPLPKAEQRTYVKTELDSLLPERALGHSVRILELNK